MQPIRFAVIGLGGYAQVHVQAVRWLARTGQARLSAVVVREQERGQHAEAIHRLRRQGVRFFSNYADLLAESTACADVLTVPTGIHQHAEISIAALQAGLHVYCEKPAAATVSEVDRMISAADRTGRLCTIGYQYLYNTTIRDLKKMICSGRTGAVRSIRVLCGWPRSAAYYQRNEWAGRLRLNDTLVLDTPANNAMAHYLFNALWLARDDANSTAHPHRVEAELFRANDIESADTVLLRVLTHEGVSIFSVFSHCGHRSLGPEMEICCEQATIRWQGGEGKAHVVFSDGEEAELSEDDDAWRFGGFLDLVRALRQGTEPVCPVGLTRAHTLTINAMHASCPRIATVPEELVETVRADEIVPPYRTQTAFRRVRGLDGMLQKVFAQQLFFSAFAAPEWPRVARYPIDLEPRGHVPEAQLFKLQ